MDEKEAEERQALDDWSTEQLRTLIERVEHYAAGVAGRRSLLGGSCTLATRRLDWQAIKFEEFSAQVCQQQWEHVISKVGKIRTVKEILESASEWLKMPIQKRGHAGLPKKPLTLYMLFHKKEAEKLKQKQPEMNLTEIAKIVGAKYKKLSEERLARLSEKHQQEVADYEEQLQQFYATHPLLKPVQKPRRPRQLFADHRVKKALQELDSSQQEDKAVVGELRKKYLAEWQNLSDKKKTRWIVKAVKQQDKYLAANPNPNSTQRFLNGKELDLLAARQGKPPRPPTTIVRYYMSTAPATPAAEGDADDPKDQDLGVRGYTVLWRELPLVEQSEHWRGYYQAVTAYQAAMKEWLSEQSAAVRESVAPEEQKFDDVMAELFAGKEEVCAKHGYTICGPRGLVEFELQRGSRLAAKYPDDAAQPGGLRRLALATYEGLSEDRRKKYEDAEVELLAKLGLSRKRRAPQAGSKAAAKRKKLDKSLVVDGVKLPPEPRKPPRSSYHTFLAHEVASMAQKGGVEAEDDAVDGESDKPEVAPAQRKPLTYLNRLWAQLSKEQKEQWEERCKAEKQHYQARLKAYKESLTPEQLAAYEGRLAEQAEVHRHQLDEAKRARKGARPASEDITVYFPPAAGDKQPLSAGSGKAPRRPAGKAGAPAEAGAGNDRGGSGPEIEGDRAVNSSDDDDDGGTGDASRAQGPSGAAGSAGAAARPARAVRGSGAAAAEAAVAGHRSPHKAASLTQLSSAAGDDNVSAVRQTARKAGLSQPSAAGGGGDGAAASVAPPTASAVAALQSPRKSQAVASPRKSQAAAAVALPPPNGLTTAKGHRKAAAVPGDGERTTAGQQQPSLPPPLDSGDETEPDEAAEGPAVAASLTAAATRRLPATVAAASASGRGLSAVAGSGGQKSIVAYRGVLKQPKGLQKAMASSDDS